MAARVFIELTAENNTQQAFRQAEQSLKALEQQTRELQGATRQTMQAFERTQRGAADLERGFTGANRGAGVLTRSLGGLGSVLGALGIAAVSAELAEFAKGSVDAATQIEGFRNGLTALYGDAQVANEVLADLDRLSELPGITFQGAVQGAIRLKTVSIEGERAVDVIREFGNSAALAGNGSEELGRAMIGLSQAIARGRIDQENLNQILENVPLIGASIREAFGSIEAQTIQDQLDAAGQSVQDFVDILVNQLATQARASVDSTANVFSNLGNALFRLQAEIGEQFLPIVRDATVGLTNFLDAIREGVDDVSTLPPEIQHLVAGAQDLYDGLQNIVEAVASGIGPEIRELIPTLTTLLGSILDLAGSIANVLSPAFQLWSHIQAVVVAAITKLAQDLNGIIGVLTDFVDWVASAWQEEDKFTQSTNRVTEAIEEVKDAATGASGSFQEYAGSLRTVLEELTSVNTELEEKKARLTELEAEGLTPADASLQQIVRRIGLLEERSKTLTASLPDLKQTLEDVNAQLEQKQARLADMREESQEATASAEQLERQIATLETVAALLNTQIALTNETLTETPSATNTASEATENYSLTLARLKARAEDARETLSNTIDFQQLSANYQAAIAESDAYYNRQIANAEAALAKEKEGSEEYQKIETDLFELRREQVQARTKLTEDASKIGETEAKRRIAVAEEENELLREAGKETARALEASQKATAAATAETQKELTRIHQENLKEREEAERASNERIVKASEDQLAILENIFENSHTEGVNQAYQNIQRATIEHYETLKSQARQRITDEDALTAELVSLDRQRNAALGENHRDYLQRIAKDAKDLLGERTKEFQEASTDILHDWERTVSQFERQLREADTEDAIHEIEADFEAGQQNMLASLESVITELGFTAEQSAEIMKELQRTAETETDSFTDKVISAFKRLGKEADRETKRQNKELERSYQELVDNIANSLGQVGDLLGDGLGSTFENVFSGLVRTASGDLFGLVDIATAAISFIQAREEELHRERRKRAEENQEFQNEQSIRVQNIQRLQRILPEAESNIRRPRPRDVDAELNRGVNRRRRLPAELQDIQGLVETTSISDVLSAQQSQRLTGSLVSIFSNAEDIITRSDIEGAYRPFIDTFRTAMDSAGISFETAIDQGLDDAAILSHATVFRESINDFYDLQIEQIRDIEKATGNVLFEEIKAINNLRNERLNEARLQAPGLFSTGTILSRQQDARSLAERTGTDQAYTEQIARLQYGDVAYDAEIGELTLPGGVEDIIDPELLSNLNISNLQTAADRAIEVFTEAINAPRRTIESINTAFTTLEPQLRELYDALFEGIAGEDGIINTAEEQIEFNQLGTFEDFTQRFRELRNTAIDATNQMQQRFTTLSQQIATNDTLKTFSEIAIAPGATVESIISEWETTVLPQINALYDQLFSDIAGEDGFINTAEEQIAFIELGSREDFVAQFENDIRNPAVNKLNSISQALAAISQNRQVSETFEAFNAAALAPGATVSGITTYWNEQVVPILQETYDNLRSEIIGEDGRISAEEELELAQAGLDIDFEDWAERYETEILTPAVANLTQSAQIIASITQNRELNAALESFNDALTAPGATVEAITTYWTENVVSVLQETYDFLRAEIIGEDGVISPQEAAELTQRGLDIPFEDWATQYENEILNPGLTQLQSVANAIAAIHRDRRFESLVEDFNAALVAPAQTIEGITDWWQTNMTPVLQETYDTLRRDIIGEDGRISPEELQRLTEAGLDVDFQDWESNFRDDILQPGIERLNQSAQILASANQSREQADVIESFNAALIAPSATITGITQFWNENVTPVLRETYDSLRRAIIGTDGQISQEEAAALAQAGLDISFEDWESIFRDDILTPGITRLASAAAVIASITQSREQENVIGQFNAAIQAPSATITGITQFWNDTVVPVLQETYNQLRTDIIGTDGEISQEEAAQLAEAGLDVPFTDWVSEYEDDILNPGIQRLENAASVIANITENRRIESVFADFNAAVVAPGATIESITTFWTENVVPVLRTNYDFLRAQIIGSDGEISTEEAAELARAGLDIDFEDWAEQYENNILSPGLQSLTQAVQSIATVTQNRELESVFEGFGAALTAPGATVQSVTEWWDENAIPVLQETYDLLRGQIIGTDGEISAQEAAELTNAGLDVSFQDWAGQYRDDIFTPGVTRLAGTLQAIEGLRQGNRQSEIFRQFESQLTAPGATVKGITDFWTENVTPVLQTTYTQLRADIIGADGQISPEELRELIQAGLDVDFQDWESQFRTDVLEPGIERLNQSAQIIAGITHNSDLENILTRFNTSLDAPGATIISITRFWTENVNPILRDVYDFEREKIIGEDGLISFEEAAELASAGLDVPFEDWAGRYEQDILQPGLQRLADTLTAIESLTQSNDLDAVLDDFKSALEAPGATIEGLTRFWTQQVTPVLRDIYDLEREKIIGADGLISPSELEALIQAGLNVPFEDWASRYEEDILQPGLQTLSDASEYLQSTELETGLENVIESFKSAVAAPSATIQSLTEQWETEVLPAIRQVYQDLHDDIAGSDGIINTVREQADLLKLGTQDEFVAGFVDDVFNPLLTALQNRQTQTRTNLAQNRISRAQFDLGGATSETDFELRRGVLIQQINAYYDAEEERIDSLKLSEDELRDLREKNRLAREQALHSAETATNQFAEERIRTETRLVDTIADLRADALNAEADYQESRVELAEKTAERIADIELRALRSQQDSRIEYARDIQDLHREATQEIEALLEGLDPSEVQQAIGAVLGGVEGNVTGLGFGDSRIQELLDIQRELNLERQEVAREQRREFEDIALREQRAVEDAGLQEDRRLAELDETRNTTLSEIAQGLEALQTTGAFTALEETLQATAALESQTAMTAATTADTQQKLAALEAETSALNATAVSTFGIGAEILQQAATDLTAFDLTHLVTSIDRLPTEIGNLAQSIEMLPTRLNEVLTTLSQRIAETTGPVSNPSSTGEATPQLPFGAPSGGQPIVIQNILQFPDGVLHHLNDTNAVFAADGRKI